MAETEMNGGGLEIKPEKEIQTPKEVKETKDKAKAEPTPVLPWRPVLTLLPKFDTPTMRVGVSAEARTVRNALNQVEDTSKKIPTRLLTSSDLKANPAFHARKYGLWSKFDVSEDDRARLMTMTVNEIAAAERSGKWE